MSDLLETVQILTIDEDGHLHPPRGLLDPAAVGPRYPIAFDASGGDDAPALNFLFASGALATFNASNYAKTVAYLSNFRWALNTPLTIPWNLVGLVADQAVLDARGFTTDSVSMTVAVTNGSTRVTIVSTTRPDWCPVQGLTVACSAFSGSPYITTGTCFTPGGALTSTQGEVGTQFDLSSAATAATGTYTLTPVMDAAVILTGASDPEDGNQAWGSPSQTTERIQVIGPAAQGGASALQALVGTDQYFIGVRVGAPNLAGNAGPAQKTLEHFVIRGFGVAVQLANNAYLEQFGKFGILNNYIGLNIPFGAANYGEGIGFRDGTFSGNCFDVISAGPGTDLHFDKVSFDYGADSGLASGNPQNGRMRKIQVFKGRVFCTHCHFEDTNDLDWWFTVNDPTTSLIIEDSDFTIAANKVAYELGLSQNLPTSLSQSAGYGGITIRNCHLNGTHSNYYLPTLIGGRGRALVEDIHNEAGGVLAAFITRTPYAPGSRYRSQVDGSFGIRWTQFTCSCSTGSDVINVTGGLVSSNINPGSVAYCSGVLAPGTTVVSAAGAAITLSANPIADNSGAFVFFDSIQRDTDQALAQWTDESTASGDKPAVDPTTRATSSDGLAFNSLKFQVGTNGHTAGIWRLFACSPNQTLLASLQILSQNLATNGDQLKLNFTFLDHTGAPVGGTTSNPAFPIGRYAFYPAWPASSWLNSGDRVTHSGTLYEASTGFTTGASFSTTNLITLTDAVGDLWATLKTFPIAVPYPAVAVKVELVGGSWHASSIAWVADLNLDFDGPAQPMPPLQSTTLASVSVAANQTGIGTVTPTDLTGLSVTFTAPLSGRVDLVAFAAALQQVTSNGTPVMYITDSSNNIKQEGDTGPVTAGSFSGTVAIRAPISGLTPGTSYTYKCRAVTTAATCSLIASSAEPATLEAIAA